ncbi:hypothetical protein MNBD_NITROSPINAE05-684 [hydrothermal vent metagenome]|uniref:Uncharacterized protein n=1 Tax=hydrothermal vent metagenome TaxID=652676 RepID=A0A3B1CXZ2_9ZZZZ
MELSLKKTMLSPAIISVSRPTTNRMRHKPRYFNSIRFLLENLQNTIKEFSLKQPRTAKYNSAKFEGFYLKAVTSHGVSNPLVGMNFPIGFYEKSACTLKRVTFPQKTRNYLIYLTLLK